MNIKNIKDCYRSIISDRVLASNIPTTLFLKKSKVFLLHRVSDQGVQPEFLSIKGIKKLGNVIVKPFGVWLVTLLKTPKFLQCAAALTTRNSHKFPDGVFNSCLEGGHIGEVWVRSLLACSLCNY